MVDHTTVSPPVCPAPDPNVQGHDCAGQAFARFGASANSSDNHPTLEDIAALDARQEAIYRTACDLIARAEGMLYQIGSELCPEAGDFSW